MDEYPPFLETKRKSSQPSLSNFNESQTLIKQQLTQIKLLSNDNQIKTQQVEILKDKVRELDEFNTIYRKQVENLENKLQLYDQELTIKIQANQEKCQKFQNQAAILSIRNEELQTSLLNCENRRKAAEEQLHQISREVLELKKQNNETFESLESLKEKFSKSESECASLRGQNQQLSNELRELQKFLEGSNLEKERLTKINEDNEKQLKKLAGVQKSYRELQAQQEVEQAQTVALKQNLEHTKKKYDELFNDYNQLLLNRQSEEELDGLKRAIGELQTSFDHVAETKREKDREIDHLRQKVLDLESDLKEQQINFENSVKYVLGLLDGKTLQLSIGHESARYKTFQVLIDEILVFNKEYQKKEARIEEVVKENSLSREELSKLKDSRDLLEIQLQEQKKQHEATLMKLNSSFYELNAKFTETQLNHNQQLEEMVKLSKQNEEKLRAMSREKEEEIAELRNLAKDHYEKINALQKEKDQAYEFLREQEAQVKNIKQQFQVISNESIGNKARISNCVYLITNLVMMFFNLSHKYEGLVFQQSILLPVFHNYFKIRNHLIISQNGTIHKQKTPNQLRLKKTGNVVIAANRLRNIAKYSSIREKVKLETLKDSIEGLSEDQVKFYHSLLTLDAFFVDKNLPNRIFDSMSRKYADDEPGLLLDVLSAGMQLRRSKFQKPMDNLTLPLKYEGMETYNTMCKLTEDVVTLLEKLVSQEKENHELKAIFASDKSRMEELLERVTTQAERGAEEHDKMIAKIHEMKNELEAAKLLVAEVIKNTKEGKEEEKAEDSEQKPEETESSNLAKQIGIISKYIDDLQSENQAKNLKVLELQKQILNSNDRSTEQFSYKDTRSTGLSERGNVENRAPSRISYSGSKYYRSSYY